MHVSKYKHRDFDHDNFPITKNKDLSYCKAQIDAKAWNCKLARVLLLVSSLLAQLGARASAALGWRSGGLWGFYDYNVLTTFDHVF
jgi:hypothetical protein